MKVRPLISLVLIVLMPLLVAGWLGWKVARDERHVVRQRLSAEVADRLTLVDRSYVAPYFEDRGDVLRGLLAAMPFDRDTLRGEARALSLVRHFFIVDNETGDLLYPWPFGDLDETEQAFLDRTTDLWQGGAAFRSGEGTVAPTEYGWHTWYAPDGAHVAYWLRRDDGFIVGAELDRVLLLADIVGALPDTDPFETDPPNRRIVLRDDRGQPVYQWGLFEPTDDTRPLVTMPLTTPLESWSLAYYNDETALGTALGRGLALNIGGGIGAISVIVVILALILYRDHRRELREAEERVSFVNQVSHELKTPLTNIRLYAELLEQTLDDADDKSQRQLGIIVSESQRLSRLIGNVLTFSRQQRGAQELRMRPGSLDDVIEGVIAQFEPALKTRGIEPYFAGQAKMLVTFDADAVEQIVGNLLSNVEKYATGSDRVDISTDLSDGRATITVSDRGPGIPDSARDKVFAPFHRLSNSLSDAVGTGIGLSIARDLARQHGGDLTLVDSDAGATFCTTLRCGHVEGEEQ